MHLGIYFHLAIQSIKKNYRVSLPFFGGSVLMAAMFYSISAMAFNPNLDKIYGGSMITTIMSAGEKIMMLFTLIFLFYLNSVWLKNRRQENGLFTILGMEKRHLIRILVYQLLLFLGATLVLGLILGICLDKIMFMLILKFSHMEPVFGFYISSQGITDTVGWMSICYGLILIWSVFMTLKTNPLEQLHGKQMGEKKIRGRWFLALAGVLLLGAGYGLALWVPDPITAFVYFFVAVILVILGTYLIFMFGSTILIQLLQKNKNFYYKPNHFISVSTLKYRLKQNAAALANISILSTMILVMLSTTTALMAGVDTTIDHQYPQDYWVNFVSTLSYERPEGLQQTVLQNQNGYWTSEQLLEEVRQSAAEVGMDIQNEHVIMQGFFNLAPEGTPESEVSAGRSVWYATAVDLEDFNRITGQNYALAENEIISLTPSIQAGMQLEGFSPPRAEKEISLLPGFVVKETIEDIPYPLEGLVNAVSSNSALIVMDMKNSPVSPVMVTVLMDCTTSSDDSQKLLDALMAKGLPVAQVNWKESAREELISLYSGVLFLGLYLSALFILVVILIMYYKQISEGLEDQQRFKIMQNVGLEPKQIRQVINDQVLLMFFLPLGMALIHLIFAYPMVDKIMQMLQMGYTEVFLGTTAICFVSFALIYIVIYRLTATTYYHLTCLPEKS